MHLTAAAPITRQARLLHPLRRERRGDKPVRVPWDMRWASPAKRFARVIGEHGPDAVGFYISGQLLTEDYYVFNKLAKGLIGTNNIDSNSRLCMSSAVAGYKLTLGADAPPNCYDDVEPCAMHLHRRQQHGMGPPDPVPAHRGREGRASAAEDHLLRPAPHRDGRHRRPATFPSSPAPT